MRSAPPVSVVIESDRAARAAVRLTAALVVVVALGWLASHVNALSGGGERPLRWWVEQLSGQGLIASALVVMAAWAAWPQRRVQRELRWDGQAWWLADLLAPQPQPMAGTVDVAVDLQAWLLLRFVPADRRTATQWLALSRGAHAPNWHALRCALYSPRPVPAAPQAPQPTHDPATSGPAAARTIPPE